MTTIKLVLYFVCAEMKAQGVWGKWSVLWGEILDAAKVLFPFGGIGFDERLKDTLCITSAFGLLIELEDIFERVELLSLGGQFDVLVEIQSCLCVFSSAKGFLALFEQANSLGEER